MKDEGQDLYATEDGDKKLEDLEKAMVPRCSMDSLKNKLGQSPN